MKRIAANFLLVGALLAGFWLVYQASASTTTYWGCLECKEGSFVTIPRDTCIDVVSEWGMTLCYEWNAWPFLTCTLDGEPCTGITVIGPGGGGGGGHGGGWNPASPCVVTGAGAWCPAECFECVRQAK